MNRNNKVSWKMKLGFSLNVVFISLILTFRTSVPPSLIWVLAFFVIAAVCFIPFAVAGFLQSLKKDSLHVLAFNTVMVLIVSIGMFAAFYSGIYESDPHSFNGQLDSNWNFLYYSITTFTTTGYGDVYPIEPISKILASIEMLFGWISSTFMMGLLGALTWDWVSTLRNNTNTSNGNLNSGNQFPIDELQLLLRNANEIAASKESMDIHDENNLAD